MTQHQATVAGVDISRSGKVLFPDDGLTKEDLAGYYTSVAQSMLPHLVDRPISMQRFPDGIEGSGFYEKKLPGHFPSWVSSVEVDTADGPQQQVTVADVRTLVLLADQACITPHTWLSRAPGLAAPDQLVVDLDPSVDDLDAVRQAAVAVHDLLDELGLPAYLKTTGSRGYHVLVPLRPDQDFDEVRGFARDLASLLAARHPDLLTVAQRKDDRGDKVLVDVMRNAYGQTVVPPYAVRARPGAPVSTPITWDELDRVEPTGFTVRNVARRLGQREDPWSGLRRHAHGLRAPRERLDRLSR